MNLAWQIVVTAASHIIGAALTEKLLISALLFACALSSYYLARTLMPPLLGWSSGMVYLLNPFVYDRLLAGQWIVLAGYALLPAALATVWQTLKHHGKRYAFRLALIIALYPLVSPHYAYIFGWLAAAVTAVYGYIEKPKWLWHKKTLVWSAAVIAGFILVNLFWLLSPAGDQFQSFNTIDFSVFQTLPDPSAGLWGNVLSLYGFWHGDAFIQPKVFLGPVWILIALLILILATIGAVRGFRNRQSLVIALALSTPVAIILAAGYASPLVRPLTVFLLHYLPGYRGLRDSAKLLAIPALAYCILAPYGIFWLAGFFKSRFSKALSATAVALLAVVNATGIGASASGQIPLADYPSGWYRTAAALQSDQAAVVAVLPWHNHMRVSFARNNYVGQPAPVFLASPTLSATEDDNILSARPATAADHLMLNLIIGTITPTHWAGQLRKLGVSYIWLEKTDDWYSYAPKLGQAGMKSVYSDSTVALYRL